MPMTDDELRALRLLLREELQAEVQPFRAEVGKRFDEIASHIDGLYSTGRKERAGVFLDPRTDQTAWAKVCLTHSGPNFSQFPKRLR
jgi:hypothetical protein